MQLFGRNERNDMEAQSPNPAHNTRRRSDRELVEARVDAARQAIAAIAVPGKRANLNTLEIEAVHDALMKAAISLNRQLAGTDKPSFKLGQSGA